MVCSGLLGDAGPTFTGWHCVPLLLDRSVGASFLPHSRQTFGRIYRPLFGVPRYAMLVCGLVSLYAGVPNKAISSLVGVPSICTQWIVDQLDIGHKPGFDDEVCAGRGGVLVRLRRDIPEAAVVVRMLCGGFCGTPVGADHGPDINSAVAVSGLRPTGDSLLYAGSHTGGRTAVG